MEFKYFVIVICGVLGLFLCYQEFKRTNKSRLWWRLLATSIMVVSLIFLIVPITYTVQKEESVHELNLITAGVIADTIQVIKGPKYTLDSSMINLKKDKKVSYLTDLAYHLQENPNIKKVNIYGYGLNQNQLALLKDKQVSFHPFSPSGIISASWPKKIKATEDLKVQGIYRNSKSEAIQLQLYGMGLILDSVLIKPNTTLNFSLQTQPKQIGKAVYQLVALQGNDMLTVEPLPFEVQNKQQAKVLILASFPDFEYKFLKKWLYENQYPIIFRSQISKNKYSTDFLNTKAIDVNRINSILLKNIDILIIDEDEFSAIAAAERATIYEAVNNGMGLIVRVTNAKPNGFTQRFKRNEVLLPSEKTLTIHTDEKLLKFDELPFPQTLFLEASSADQPLFRDNKGKIVANLQLQGLGKVLSSSIASTYQWELAGKKQTYANFWSTLLEKTAKRVVKDQSIEIYPFLPTQGDRVRLIVNSEEAKVPSMGFNNIKLAPRQNMELPFKWDGIFWPTIAGWNTITVNNKMEDVFIYQQNAWIDLKNAQKLNATTSFVANQPKVNVKSEQISYLKTEEISKWWFFALFLISISFLWYEQRFLANK